MIKRDGNEAEIVKSLRAIGCSVQLLHGNTQGCPDLLVGFAGRTVLMEVKADKGRLLASQQRWHNGWRGSPVVVVRTVNDALSALGLKVAA